MSKSKESWNKKELESKRKKKKDDKQKRKDEKKAHAKETGKKSFEDMIAYVDEFGRITSEKPDATKRTEVSLDDISISTPTRIEDENEAEKLHSGKVQFFNTAKGYGFIKGNGRNESYFVHQNDLLESITENDSVEFKIEAAQRGMKAVEVRKAKAAVAATA